MIFGRSSTLLKRHNHKHTIFPSPVKYTVFKPQGTSFASCTRSNCLDWWPAPKLSPQFDETEVLHKEQGSADLLDTLHHLTFLPQTYFLRHCRRSTMKTLCSSTLDGRSYPRFDSAVCSLPLLPSHRNGMDIGANEAEQDRPRT